MALAGVSLQELIQGGLAAVKRGTVVLLGDQTMKTGWQLGVVLVLFAVSGVVRADEAEAVAALKKMGATVIYTNGDPKKGVDTLFLPKGTDESLKQVAVLTKMRVLKLDAASKITDAGLKELTGLKQLRDPGLGSTQVTDAGLKQLTALKDLEKLNLNFTKVTDAGLKDLATLTKLELLGLSFTQVTKDGVKKLQESLPKCKIIH